MTMIHFQFQMKKNSCIFVVCCLLVCLGIPSIQGTIMVPWIQRHGNTLWKNLKPFFSVEDERLLPYRFWILELIKDTQIYIILTEKVIKNQPEVAYNYITNYIKMNVNNFRKKGIDTYYEEEYYEYSQVVTNKLETLKFEFILKSLPEIIKKLNVDFNIKQLVETLCLLRADAHEEKSTRHDVQSRLF